MEKIKLTTTDPAEELEVYVLEETTINQQKYLLVAEEDTGDCEVEFSAVLKVFEELLEDTDFER